MKGLKSNILKFVALMLIATTLQSYACSSFCSIEASACCAQEQPKADCCHPNNPVSEHSEKSGDCQKEHFDYFNTIGQFHSKNQLAVNIAILPIEITTASIALKPLSVSNNLMPAFTGFHPPPPKYGMPVLVSSFLI